MYKLSVELIRMENDRRSTDFNQLTDCFSNAGL